MSSVRLLIPRTLMSTIGEQRILDLEVAATDTVSDLLDSLAASYPTFDRRIRDETGAQRRYVNIYVDGEDVRRADGLATPIANASEVQIIQSVAGG
jgi:molybdopterin converting factor small subunit